MDQGHADALIVVIMTESTNLAYNIHTGSSSILSTVKNVFRFTRIRPLSEKAKTLFES